MRDHRTPARKNALSLLIGLSLAAALALLAVRCTSRSDHGTPSVPAVASTHGEERPSAAPPPAATQAPAPAVADHAEPAATPDAGAPTNIGRLMRATDAHDRDLLATIERKTHAAPPSTVRELLELRRAGKSRAELERFIDGKLGGGIAVRSAAMQWLRAIHGEPEPTRDIGILSRPNTTDPAQRTVKPLTKKPEQ